MSGWKRAGMWARRNPALAICIAALIAALGYGIVAQQVALGKARKARADAENLIEFMDQELTEKLRPLGRLDLTGDVIRKAEAYFREQDEANSGPDFLMRKASFFRRAAELERELGKLPEAQQMATKGLTTLERFQKENAGEAEAWSLRSDLELLLFRLSKTLGNKLETEDYGARALEHQRRALELSPTDSKTVARLCEVLLDLEEFRRAERDMQGAERMLMEASDRLRKLAEENPKDLRVRRLLAITHYHKAGARENVNDTAAALTEYNFFIKDLEEIAHMAADDRDWQFELAVAYGRAASAHYALNDRPASEALIAKWRSTAETLAAFDPNNVHWRASFAQSLAWSALVLRSKNESDEGIPTYFRRALEIYEQLSVQNPNEEEYFDRIAQLSGELELFYKKSGQLGKAEEVWRSHLARQWETAVRHPWRLSQQKRLAQAFETLTFFLEDQGRSAEATRLCEEWIAAMPKRFAQAPEPYFWHWPQAQVHELLANIATRELRFDDSAEHWRRCIDLLKGLHGGQAVIESAPALVYAFSSLVSLQQKRNDPQSLAAVANEALDWLDESPAKSSRLKAELCQGISDKALALRNRSPTLDQVLARCRN